MENKKRKAEISVDIDLIEEKGKETIETEPVINEKDTSKLDDNQKEDAPMGFSAYAKINPFAAATANLKSGFGGFGTNNFGSASGFGNSFGSSSFGSFGNSNNLKETIADSETSNKRPGFVLPTPLILPSPKSPKPNPFSSPSPVHNPFMTIVESKDELWKTMAKDKLSDEEAAKSSVFFSVHKKARLGHCNDNSPEMAQEDATDIIKNDTCEDNENDEEEKDSPESPSISSNIKTYPLPENVPVITGEEDDECLFLTRGKLYRLVERVQTNGDLLENESKEEKNKEIHDSKSKDKIDINNLEWVEVGVGPIKILQAKAISNNQELLKDQKLNRIVMRREDKKGGIGTKLILNVRLNQFVSVSPHGEKLIRLTCFNYIEPIDSKLNELKTFVIKTKSQKESDELLDYITSFSSLTKSQTSN